MRQEISLNFELPTGHLHGGLEFEEKKITCLSGENGIGKTSMLMEIFHQRALLFPTKRLGFCFQRPLQVLGELTPRDAFSILKEECFFFLAKENTTRFELIKDFDFTDRMDRPISLLSGGENQILKLLLNLYLHSDLLLLDEPTQSLSPKRRDQLAHALKALAQERKMMIFIVDHHQDFLESCGDFFYRLGEGPELQKLGPHHA